MRVNLSKFELPDDDPPNINLFAIGQDRYEKRPNDYQVRFSYHYLNIGKVPKYCFNHPEFSADDYKTYFQRVQEYSSCTLDQLVEEYSKHNLRISNPSKKDRILLERITGAKNLSYENTPEVGHFHLEESTSSDGRSKKPVIHFFVGRNGVLHILCFDPFHEVHTTNH